MRVARTCSRRNTDFASSSIFLVDDDDIRNKLVASTATYRVEIRLRRFDFTYQVLTYAYTYVYFKATRKVSYRVVTSTFGDIFASLAVNSIWADESSLPRRPPTPTRRPESFARSARTESPNAPSPPLPSPPPALTTPRLPIVRAATPAARQHT